MSEHWNLRSLAIVILCNARQFKWTVQGLGMLRMHILPNLRLHIWHSSLRVPNVSDVHDHLQWHLKSTVICGRIQNVRFMEYEDLQHFMLTTWKNSDTRDAIAYNSARIKAGVGGGIEKLTGFVGLEQLEVETYLAGQSYSQQAKEIHRSLAADGTITIMEKTPTEDTHGARVFWREGNWVSAEPRDATTQEIDYVTQYALAVLTGGKTPAQHHVEHIQV